MMSWGDIIILSLLMSIPVVIPVFICIKYLIHQQRKHDEIINIRKERLEGE